MLRPDYLLPTSRLVLVLALSVVAACGGGGGGASLTTPAPGTDDGNTVVEPTPDPEPDPELGPEPPASGSDGDTNGPGGDDSGGAVTEPPAPTVTISGTVTFDLVSHKADSAGLDYQNVERAPAQKVNVRLLDGAGQTLAEGRTDAAGSYTLQAPVDTPVRVRAEARMEQAGSPAWAFAVRDNTQADALYVLDGQLVTSGQANTVRDLHATSGWNGTGYTAGNRSAAPFAILDTVREAVDALVAVDPGVQLPSLQLFWSPNNIPVNGNESAGEIGTSFYTPVSGSIYLLGDEDDDTDEYDRSVISHEFAHYLEDQLSRTESIGGAHTGRSQLDMRVAFSEGLGNAFAGIATGDSIYRDSIGNAQSRGLSIDIASNTTGNHGWYSESSVQTILYGLFDQQGRDFGPLYRALTGEGFLNFDGAISIYPFVTTLRAAGEVSEQLIDNLLQAENIQGTDGYGSAETNDGGSAFALPIYRTLTAGGAQEVCSSTRAGEYNGMDVRRFATFSVASSGPYTLTVRRSSGLSETDPDFTLWRRGQLLEVADTVSPNQETLANIQLAADTPYWLEIYEYTNTDGETSADGQQPKPDACFTVVLENAP